MVNNKTFSITDLEVLLTDDFKAYRIIEDSLYEGQMCIIHAMSLGADLIQVYSNITHKTLWDMTGINGIIPHLSSVKALIRKNLIVPTMSNKEWTIQVALGATNKRIWQLQPTLLEPLQNAVCLIRTIEENLKAGNIFKCKS